jgi:hypothetical protein
MTNAAHFIWLFGLRNEGRPHGFYRTMTWLIDFRCATFNRLQIDA